MDTLAVILDSVESIQTGLLIISICVGFCAAGITLILIRQRHIVRSDATASPELGNGDDVAQNINWPENIKHKPGVF